MKAKEDIIKIDQSEKFPNTALFKKLMVWQRTHTRPTPFLVNDEKINSSVRIGHECFSWINDHPQLIQQNIKVFIPEKRED